MRDPSLRRVQRTRDIVAVVLRLFGVWLLVLRVPSLASQTGVLIWTASSANPRRTGWTVADEPWVFANGALLLVSLVVGVLALMKARSLARWLVPLPREACPGCDYPLARRGGTSPGWPDRCPECGLRLTVGVPHPSGAVPVQSESADSQE